MLNKYVNRSRISEAKFRELVKLFSIDLEADQTAKVTGLSRNTINKYYKVFRERIVELCELDSPFTGEVEVDESYFGARRIKGKRGRGAYGKTKECEFRFNHRGEDLYTFLLQVYRNNPLKLS